MQISQHFSQRMEQKLVMTRQMIQSIEMLQLPLMDLEQNINQEVNANPWLERQEGEAVPDSGESGQRKKTEKTERELNEAAQQSASETDARVKRLETLMNEWNDPNTRSSSGLVRRAGEDDAKMEAMQNTAAPTISLEDHLLQQLHLSKEEPRLKELAEVIVGSLDESGYLKIPLMELFYKTEGGIRQELVPGGCTEEEAELALELVQSLEPAGVGARNVGECLILQLQRTPGTTEFEEQLISKHLDDLSHNRLPKIAKDMGVSVERIKEGLANIAHLNPKPGRGFGGGRPQYVVPDVHVEEIDGQHVIRINEHFLPTLRISGDSLQLLKKEAKDVAVRDYIMGKLGSAVWLMESVIQRRNTLYRITQQIVDIQKDFFEHGPSHLKPLMMQEVAERIGMHVSTVSRALAGKYIQTPQGLFPMKYFFTGGFSTGDGEAESNRAIMLKISEMVKGEDKKNPLSDQEIVARLQAEGVDIARRTVAKYREKLNIPSSRQRKEY
jgi:RNA polymerase sigma-54 factor